jgi:uncharacterized membrane protein
MRDAEPSSSNWLAPLAFVIVVAALVAGVWLFPRIYAYMSEQDCIASGRTNCVRFAPPADKAMQH